MFSLILRGSLWMLAFFTGGLLLLPALQFDSAFYDEARAFLLESENCESTPCFLGVIPGETPAQEIDEQLLSSRYVVWADLVDIRTRFDHVNWRWSGTQPTYIQADGRIDISPYDDADWITLLPELSLAQLLLILGEPEIVGGQFSQVMLRYPQTGILVRFPVACTTFWQIQPEVEIHDLESSDVGGTLDERYRELCSTQWP